MNPLKFFPLLLSFAILEGCGDQPIYVADSVDMKVQFSSKLVSLKFQLNSEFRMRRELHQNFVSSNKTLSQIYLIRDDQGELSMGSLYSGEDLSPASWPVKKIKKIGGIHSLPKCVKTGELNSWMLDRDRTSIRSLYQDSPHLVIGAAILDAEFDYLPLNFVGVQDFKNSKGEIIASIHVLGPTASNLGGVYFLANYGLNPFVFLETDSKDVETQMVATENFVVLDPGQTRSSLPQIWNWIY